jgi:hypothetical protein
LCHPCHYQTLRLPKKLTPASKIRTSRLVQLPRLSPPRLAPTKPAPHTSRSQHPWLSPPASRLPNPRLATRAYHLPASRLPNPHNATCAFQTTRLPNPRLASLATTKTHASETSRLATRSYPLATTKPAPPHSQIIARSFRTCASPLASTNPAPTKSDLPTRATTSRLGFCDPALPNSNPETRRYENQNPGPPLPKTRRYQN